MLRESKFKEHGRITPGELPQYSHLRPVTAEPGERKEMLAEVRADLSEEFVAAGDFLTFKFPVWQWSAHPY